MKVKNIKIGDKFKGLVNNEIFEIMEIHKEKDEIIFKNKNKCFLYGLEAFKRCLLAKINQGEKIMEKIIDIKYAIYWRINQLIHKIINKPVKGYKRTLTIKKILKGG